MRLLLTIVAVALVTMVFVGSGVPDFRGGVLVALIAAGACEALGVRLPYFGTVSLGLVVYLPLICLDGYGGAVAVLIALIAIGAREAVSYTTPSRLLDEMLLDLLPLSLAALVPTYLHDQESELLLWLGAGLTFVSVRQMGVRFLSSGLKPEESKVVKRLQMNTADIRWGLLGLSLVTIPLVQHSPYLTLALVPVLFSFRKAAIHAYAWLDRQDKLILRSVAGELSKSLTEAESEISKLSSALETTESERNLLFELSQDTATCRSLPDLVRILERKAANLGLGSSLQLLLQESNGWLYVELDEKGRPAISEVRFDQVGAGFRRCWQGSKTCLSKSTGRAFYPLPGVGVLSVQRPRAQSGDAGQREVVTLFCNQVGLACLSARRFELVQKALGQLAQLNDGLRARNQALIDLTNHLKELSACKTLEEACARLPQTGGMLFGPRAYRSVAIVRGDEVLYRHRAEAAAPGATRELRAAIDEEHSLIMQYALGAAGEQDEEVLAVGFQCTQEILSQILLSRSLQNALEQLRKSEAKLIQSAKLAAVGQLSAGLAHEINNPLGSIKLAIEITLRKEELGDFSRDLMEKALKGVDRAQNIIGSLLSYSRSGAKGRKPISAWDVVFDACSFVEASLRVQDVALELPERGPEAIVEANPQELQQILTNLVLNAKDAVAGQQKPLVRVKAYHRPTGEFCVEVHDNGPGVPQGVREKVFDPFFTTKPVGKGTGLGLSVSRELAEAQEGTLEVGDSQELGGACFLLTLPLKK